MVCDVQFNLFAAEDCIVMCRCLYRHRYELLIITVCDQINPSSWLQCIKSNILCKIQICNNENNISVWKVLDLYCVQQSQTT